MLVCKCRSYLRQNALYFLESKLEKAQSRVQVDDELPSVKMNFAKHLNNSNKPKKCSVFNLFAYLDRNKNVNKLGYISIYVLP